MTPEQIADRQAAEDLLEQGWAGTFLVEPLTALAGGILGGAAVTAVAWRLAWRPQRRRYRLAVLDHAGALAPLPAPRRTVIPRMPLGRR